MIALAGHSGAGTGGPRPMGSGAHRSMCIEGALDDLWILDQRNDAHRPFALGVLQRIGLVNLPDEPNPGDPGAHGESGARFLAWRRQPA